MKPYNTLISCLILSAVVWLMYNLSRSYTNMVSVEVLAVSNLEGRSSVSVNTDEIAARCKATGYRLIRLGWSKSVVKLTVDPSDLVFEEGDSYSLLSSSLEKYTKDIFGPGVSVEAYIGKSPVFRFQKEEYKKIPVRAMCVMSFRDQYMPASPMVLKPDSVLVYGDPERLEGIDELFTKHFKLSDISRTFSGVAQIECPAGVRLSTSTVSYRQDVVRFVEIRSKVPVSVRGVPSGVDISTFPSEVDVSLYCEFPLNANPFDMVEFYVDYHDYQNSVDGQVLIRSDNIPSCVVECRTSPMVVECLENF